MEYVHDQYPYPPPPPRQQVFYHPGSYPPYLQQPPHAPHQRDEFYMPYEHPDYAEYMAHGQYQDEFDDAGEVATRPRLTKEQVGVLEAQFQANHKPNSMVKRQLAMQTNLSLPRVANWFQNRRAKAKQQKKQEEFENRQLSGRSEGDDLGEVKEDDDQTDDEDDLPFQKSMFPAAEQPANDASQKAGWASLQRALHAAKAAQIQPPSHAHAVTSTPMPPPPMQHESTVSASHVGLAHGTNAQNPHVDHLPKTHSWANAWASHQVFQDQSFDFGFSNQAASDCPPPGMDSLTMHQHLQEQATILPTSWQDGVSTPTRACHDTLDSGHEFHSPDLPLPLYPESRRGSGADSLTNNFDAFALANDSPHAITTSVPAMPLSHAEASLDLAARRNRPRPAALTSASLRSRSYGALTSMSPTFRTAMSPSAHTVRQVKSTGHNLNGRYSGIRKPSSAQRSPITISTFAEAEAFNRLMHQQAATVQGTIQQMTEHSGPLLSPPLMVNTSTPVDYVGNSMAQKMDLARTYQLPTTEHLTLMTTSPPTTPFATEYDLCSAAYGMPPISAPLQYASFPDYTPPYSAGPLTNSSWSDAPLTSPELPNFPQVTYIPSLAHTQKHGSVSGHFSEFVLASDSKPEMDSISNASEQRKTDFFIQEFPNQKEEHANVARQLAQNTPKNYVFANSAASDYDQT